MKLIEKYMDIINFYNGSKYTVKTTKDKDAYKLENLYGTNWNLYIREIDDNSILISDNGEGIKYLEGLGIDMNGVGIRKAIVRLLDRPGLQLSDSKCIFHEFKWKSSLAPFLVYKALREIEDIGQIYIKYNNIFKENK
jgi:hypothetical protein